MKELIITDEILRAAAVKSISVGKLNNSFTNGSRNIIGFIGEELYLSISKRATRVDDYDCDFILTNGISVDVKSRIVSRKPDINYDFILKRANKSQKVDFYVFFCIKNTLDRAWLVGWATQESINYLPEFSVGDVLPQGGLCKAGGHRILIEQMSIK